MSFQNKAWT